MFHDILARFQQVEALRAHEVHRLGQAALDEVVALGIVVGLLRAVDVQLRQAVVYHIPRIEIDAPSQSLLDLWLSALMQHLPRAPLPIPFLDLAVPAAGHPRWVLVLALDLPNPVGAVGFPAVQKRVLAKFLPLYYFVRQAHAILLALYGHFLALQALVDHRGALRRGGHVAIDLFVLSEGGRDDGPLDRIGLEMRLVLHQPIQIALLHLVKLPEEVLLVEHGDDLLEQDREIPEGLGGVCAEDLVPGDEPPQVGLELEWCCIEVALAVGPEVFYGNIFAEAYILQLPGL